MTKTGLGEISAEDLSQTDIGNDARRLVLRAKYTKLNMGFQPGDPVDYTYQLMDISVDPNLYTRLDELPNAENDPDARVVFAHVIMRHAQIKRKLHGTLLPSISVSCPLSYLDLTAPLVIRYRCSYCKVTFGAASCRDRHVKEIHMTETC
ncbi:hypothetical protein Ciccas_007416 [Cichlidogyrus casuarinus]|uniref:C2H2-type domain-containing protein n=1 Tax=Cichlidogyrus casuarinus TaxID=1844966 RepID=A0ABD2Q3N9_9PLAT